MSSVTAGAIGVGFNILNDVDEVSDGGDVHVPETPGKGVFTPSPEAAALVAATPPLLLQHASTAEIQEEEVNQPAEEVAVTDPKGKKIMVECTPPKQHKTKKTQKNKEQRPMVIPLPSAEVSAKFISHIPKLDKNQACCFERGVPSLPQFLLMVSQLGKQFMAGTPTRSTFGAVEQENAKLRASNAALEKELEDLKNQLAFERQDRKEREELQAQVEREAARRHEETKDELKQALAKHAQELQRIEAESAQKLKDLQASHNKALQENAVASVQKYLSGSRNAFRTDYHANYRYGLLDLMYKHKLSEAKLGHVKADYGNTLDFPLEPPLYKPPPIGAFSDDGDCPLEVWTPLPLSRDPASDSEKAKLFPDPIRTLRPKLKEIARANQAHLPLNPLAPVPSQTIADAQRRKL